MHTHIPLKKSTVITHTILNWIFVILAVLCFNPAPFLGGIFLWIAFELKINLSIDSWIKNNTSKEK